MEESVEASMVDREMRGGARSGREVVVVVVVMMGRRGKRREAATTSECARFFHNG